MTIRKQTAGPSVLRFKSRLVRHVQPGKNAKGVRLDIPTTLAKKLRRMTRVEGIINGHPFRAALDSDKTGGYSLGVNKAMLGGAGAEVGDTVSLAILGPEGEARIPSDLRLAMNGSSEAKEMWKELTIEARRDWIRWIEAARTGETRARRIARTVDQLAEGKRRPCCVNFYEYMLQRVQE